MGSQETAFARFWYHSESIKGSQPVIWIALSLRLLEMSQEFLQCCLADRGFLLLFERHGLDRALAVAL